MVRRRRRGQLQILKIYDIGQALIILKMIFTKGDWFESNLVELLKGVGGGGGGGAGGGGGGGGCKSCKSIILAKLCTSKR